MQPRLFPLLAAAASTSLACVASTKCLPAVSPVRTTLVRGDVEQLVVTEFGLIDGCTEIVLDSIVRRSAIVDTLATDRKWGGEASAALTLHLRATFPELDPAVRAGCMNRRMHRRVDRAPLAMGGTWMPLEEGSATVVSGIVPVDPDSVFVCLGGSCQRRPADVVDNRPEPTMCLDGALGPISKDSARAQLLERLAKARVIVDLSRRASGADILPLAGRIGCVIVDPVAARTVATADVVVESRLLRADNNWTAWGALPLLSPWSDPRISADLAKPNGYSAGDYFEEEVLSFSVHPLRGPATVDFQRSWNYASGVKTYQYGGMESKTAGCLLRFSPRDVGDSLRLEGESVRLNNEGCGRRDVDVFANDHSRWLFAPEGDDWAASFRHGANLENGSSWPIEGDSVVVRGWKFALDGILAAVSVSKRSVRGSELEVRAIEGTISIHLDQPGVVDLVSPNGRLLASASVAAGDAMLPIPAGHHGLLLVRAPSGTARLMVP
jgi:hypothetical protein